MSSTLIPKFIGLFPTIVLFLFATVLRFFPGLEWTFEVTWIICILVFLLVIFSGRLIVDIWVFYLIFAAAFLVFSSAMASSREFGQPIIFGVLANRQYFIVFGVISFYLIFAYGLNAADCPRLFGLMILRCFWVNLIGNFLLQTVGRGAFGQVEALYVIEEDRLRLSSPFILMGIFYYYELTKKSPNNWRYFLFIFLGLCYFLVFDGGRSNLICIALVLLFSSLWGANGLDKKIFTLIKFFVVSVSVVGGFFIFSGEVGQKLAEKYSEAFFVVMTGQEGLDDSANSRIQQAEIIIDGVEKNPLFGNGFLSAQFHEGFKTFFGHFHPSDNGFGGVVYVWGYVGLFVVCLQLIPMVKYFTSVRHFSESVALWLMTFYHLLFSVVSGKLAFSFEFSVMIISMMIIVMKIGVLKNE